MPTAAAFSALMDAMDKTRLVVVGDAMLDVYMRGTSNRQMPEAPAPVILAQSRSATLGGAANMAANAAALAGHVDFICLTGADAVRDELCQIAQGCGLETGGFIVDESRPTVSKNRFLANDTYVARVDYEKTHDVTGGAKQALLDRFDECLAQAQLVVLSDYCKGVLSDEVIAHCLKGAAARGIPVLVDSKKQDWTVFKGTLAAKPNKKELFERAPGVDVEKSARALIKKTGIAAMIVSLSEEGVMLVGDQESVSYPAMAGSVREVSGAGDTLLAGLAASLAAGASLADAVEIGNIAAGLAVEQDGTSLVGKQELRKAVLTLKEERARA